MNEMIFQQVQLHRKRFQTSDPFELLDGMRVVLNYSTQYSRNGLRGYCTVMNRTKYVVINDNLTEEDKRIVAAHEAAHLILHRNQLKAGAMSDFDFYNTKSRLERQANQFAADFLLDDEYVMDIMQSQEAGFEDAAKQLLIPPPFFAFKLHSMSQRGYNIDVPVNLNSTFLKTEARG